MRDICQKKSTSASRSAGFTLIELLVVMAITVLISSLYLANYRQGERTRSVKIAADSIQSGVRLMQNNTLAGLPTPAGTIAADYGIDLNATNYKTFVDDKSNNRTILETVQYPANVTLSSLLVGGQSVSSVEILFFPPFATIKMTAGSYNQAPNLKATFSVVYTGGTSSRALVIDGLSGRIQTQ